MKKAVITQISKGLHDKLKSEKIKLQKKESQKIRSRRKNITMWDASQSLVRRLNK